jgi:hypothetical protein
LPLAWKQAGNNPSAREQQAARSVHAACIELPSSLKPIARTYFGAALNLLALIWNILGQDGFYPPMAAALLIQ